MIDALWTRLSLRHRPAANCFLLFHKCGNNYTNALHRLDRGQPYVRDVRMVTARRINRPRPGRIVNFRCRNFDLACLVEHGLLHRPDARFVVFTRHPASFVLSATRYHLRGTEAWARRTAQPHLGGQTLTGALRAAPDEGARQIITMTHFSWLFERMVSFVPCFEERAFLRIRIEELFTARDPAYYEQLAAFLRLGDRAAFRRALMAASPAFKPSLPDHATGSFRQADPVSALAPAARAYYAAHWQQFAERLGY